MELTISKSINTMLQNGFEVYVTNKQNTVCAKLHGLHESGKYFVGDNLFTKVMDHSFIVWLKSLENKNIYPIDKAEASVIYKKLKAERENKNYSPSLGIGEYSAPSLNKKGLSSLNGNTSYTLGTATPVATVTELNKGKKPLSSLSSTPPPVYTTDNKSPLSATNAYATIVRNNGVNTNIATQGVNQNMTPVSIKKQDFVIFDNHENSVCTTKINCTNLASTDPLLKDYIDRAISSMEFLPDQKIETFGSSFCNDLMVSSDIKEECINFALRREYIIRVFEGVVNNLGIIANFALDELLGSNWEDDVCFYAYETLLDAYLSIEHKSYSLLQVCDLKDRAFFPNSELNNSIVNYFISLVRVQNNPDGTTKAILFINDKNSLDFVYSLFSFDSANLLNYNLYKLFDAYCINGQMYDSNVCVLDIACGLINDRKTYEKIKNNKRDLAIENIRYYEENKTSVSKVAETKADYTLNTKEETFSPLVELKVINGEYQIFITNKDGSIVRGTIGDELKDALGI